MTFRNCVRFITALLTLAACQPALATADGPDHFRVAGVAPGNSVGLYAEANPKSPVLGQIPADAQCLRNLGCQGGVSFEEFNTLSSEAQKLRAAANPRWCKVDYRGTTGWVEGRFVAEGACPTGAEGGARKVSVAAGRSVVTLKGRIKGDDFVDYLLRAGAGQALKLGMQASNRMAYFNLLPPGSTGEAMFADGGGERQFDGHLPADGVYTIRVYLIRAAARRNERSSFTLSAALSGKALTPVSAMVDALIPGTPYHAQATIKCAPAYTQTRSCEAFVIRRDFEGTATVEIRWDQGRKRHILFVKGKPTVADVPMPMRFTKDARGNVTIDFDGQDRFEIPEALVVGG